jgi:hypothetical protein
MKGTRKQVSSSIKALQSNSSGSSPRVAAMEETIGRDKAQEELDCEERPAGEGLHHLFRESAREAPVSRLIRHHPVSAQAYQCTSFASGLRPQPWRGGNTNGGHLERGGGSERSVYVCRRG